MNLMRNDTVFICPKCGHLHNENVKIYNENLRKQSFNISPILPTCLICGSEITLNSSSICGDECEVIVLTGTCGSGKSSSAEILMEKHGFGVIDGDCVMQVVKHKLGVNKIQYNEPPMYREIENQIDILLALKKDIVISNIVTTQDIQIYRKIFKQRALNYKIFLLQPQYAIAIARTKARSCHKSITPEEWVKYFYDELSKFNSQSNEDVIVFDNSDYSVEKSVHKILEEYCKN
ncbi:AAA family ATPase [Clostridium sp. C2-6-12]|uniref:AAA family ATPase n=1 Tax=Clostridium sp. C2-6-12 TaxID=2698832 RepID=UPI00136FBAC8|nr:AAA family ATPase [Clostridium sp. C2-6-12]